MASTRKIIYAKGDKVGFCIFVEEVEPIKYLGTNRRSAKFICKCGKEFIGMIGQVKSKIGCGCRIGITPHGQAIGNGTSEYRAWTHLKGRCECKNDKSYHRYGGRGIKICERWRNSFENFFEDMGKKPSAKHTVDRIDNNGNYEPSNCRWATPIEQARNRRSSTMITYNNITLSLRDWADKMNLPGSVLQERLKRYNWPLEMALNKPLRKWPTKIIQL